MSEQHLSDVTANLAHAGAAGPRPISKTLVQSGIVSPTDMLGALAQAAHSGTALDRILVADGLTTPDQMLSAQARQLGVSCLDPAILAPDATLCGLLDPAFCLKHGILPWTRIGPTTVIATARPEEFQALRPQLTATLGPVVMGMVSEADIQALIVARHGGELAARAETCVIAAESSRDINRMTLGRGFVAAGFAAACLAFLAFAPTLFFAVIVALALITLLMAQGLKLAALFASRAASSAAALASKTARPTVSLLVPLVREQGIAATLITRLSRLDYPKALLDVILVLEAGDSPTRAALDQAEYPPWMRIVEVPPGTITTKPRAMNYALSFCRGEIIGVYDAEDAPAANQISRVADRFSQTPDHVACIQGILDFYNPRANWLSRCFAIEYATWFRVLLPGLARLGFAIPLGGTTVFFRRAALEKVRGWDAHNVTEDADLGIRLARYGYVTELLPTVTREEANNRIWPWIKQRSRWLKGYMVTYRVHMRRPARLMHTLGPWKFLGFQLVFLTAILQFLLLPALWSFWLIVFGLPHPLSGLIAPGLMTALISIFLISEAISLLVSLAAVARSPHDGLLIWVPTMFLYFPLGVVAAYKGLYELVVKPFYWDKTTHGHSPPDNAGADQAKD
ncbi:glycosyltransferase family 2 protein [Puniceibacterium sediminis]|uniref:Glycosyltransferase, catalytic subunit of cellulose synthase and poly-beta-1,6-N-acetylglucosamine synthase n=1 Tax=Puniceibacterium sediminis TaxID=1608407 RepID=A0A238WBB0_9RHOB|nr:glycosyltransferase family 2 protein [Puniceibacterium sediminis]SNR43842.1 Glycosyltransferase, catalytic subunit of cellulose synthase and poly-beta-1,6-N-acetylglucosamine synthase [Puniceibacterium sediminis]